MSTVPTDQDMLPRPRRKVPPEERFERLLSAPDPITGCRLWLGHVINSGYGQFEVTWIPRRMELAHRYAWEAHYGELPPAGIQICHTCDARTCAEWSHLFQDTSAGNHADMREKGRSTAGEKHWNVRLTDDQVVAIRRSYEAGGVLQKQLAQQYGVTFQTISDIVRGRRRRNLL